MVIVAKGDVVSLIFFYLSTPFFLFILLFKNGHFTSLLLPLPYFSFTFKKWPLVQMVVLRKRGMQCSVDDPRDRRGSRIPDRLSEPTRTHHVCCTSCTYMPRLCLNCVPTRTHHACPVIPSRVLLRLVTLFINAMI